MMADHLMTIARQPGLHRTAEGTLVRRDLASLSDHKSEGNTLQHLNFGYHARRLAGVRHWSWIMNK